MVHRILWRVGSNESLDYWEGRLPESTRTDAGLLFADPEGLEHELLVADVPDAPLPATGAGVPREHALLGFHGVRAYREDVSRTTARLAANCSTKRSTGCARRSADCLR